MTRFEYPNAPAALNSDRVSTDVPHVSDLSLDEIQAHIARGRHMRNAYIADWGRRMFQTFASIFRRPGRLAVPSAHINRHAA